MPVIPVEGIDQGGGLVKVTGGKYNHIIKLE